MWVLVSILRFRMGHQALSSWKSFESGTREEAGEKSRCHPAEVVLHPFHSQDLPGLPGSRGYYAR